MNVPISLLKSEWPPNEGLKRGNKRFDTMFTSVKREGIRKPLTINLKWVVIDGQHRLVAAKLLGIERIEVQVWTGTEMIL